MYKILIITIALCVSCVSQSWAAEESCGIQEAQIASLSETLNEANAELARRRNSIIILRDGYLKLFAEKQKLRRKYKALRNKGRK